MTSLFSSVRNLWGAISNPQAAAASAATAVVQGVTDSLQDHRGSEIDQHIAYLHELTSSRVFQRSNGSAQGLEKNVAFLEDFIKKIDNMLASGPSLFGIDFTDTTKPHIAQDKQPFLELQKRLQQEIKYLREHPDVTDKTLDSSTVDATFKALGKLRTLKLKASGALSGKPMALTAAPELASCLTALGGLQDALNSQDRAKISAACGQLSTSVETVLKRQKDIFINKPLTQADAKILRELREIAIAYQTTPDSLKYTRLLKPIEMDVMGHIEQGAHVLSAYVKDQGGMLTTLMSHLTQSVGTALVNALPSTSSNSALFFSSFEKFHDACIFFKNPRPGYTQEETKEILLTLLKLCGPEFETHFLNTIATPHAHNHDIAKAHLLDYPDLLDKALKEALKDYAQRKGLAAGIDIPGILKWTRTHEVQPTAATGVPHRGAHALMDYVQAAIQYLQGKSSCIESILPTVGKTFTSVLQSDALNAWVDKQKPQDQMLFKGIKDQVLNALRTSNTPAEYIHAFEEFKNLFNAQHWILEGFELPTLFQDSKTYAAQMNAAENLAKTMSVLRKDLDTAKVKQDIEFDWADEQKASAKITEQLQTFSKHLQDQLTYQLIYEKLVGSAGPNDTTFYTIKKLQAAQPNEALRQKVFLKEMKTAINNSSASWITKMFARIILFRFHKLVGHYTGNIVHNFYNNLDKELNKIDKTSLLVRSSHCFSKYNALLQHWASLPHGGDKTPAINRLMQTKEYLEYENQSYTQPQLYTAISNTFVNNYFHFLYTDNGNSASLRGFLNSTGMRLNRMILRRPFHSRGPIASVANFLWSGCKALVIGLPVHLLIFASKLVITPFEWLSNYFARLICKSSLNHFKAIDNVIQSTRQGIYEESPYVHIITNFVANQFEELSKALEDDKQSTLPVDTSVVSERTRADIKKTLEHLFELLDKDRFTTQEKLTEHLKSTGPYKTINTQLENLIIPSTIESLIDLTLVLSDKVLTRKSLNQPISLLIDQFNELLTQPPNTVVSDVDKKKYKAAEEKMHKYADKILLQVVDKAVNNAFDNFGQEEAKYAKTTLDWAKTTMHSLLEKWTPILNEIETQEDDKKRYDELAQLITASDAFLVEMQNKYDVLNAKASRTSREVAEKLLQIMTPFKEFLRGNQNEGAPKGLLGLYSNYNHLYREAGDLPYLSTCIRSYDTMQTQLAALVNDISNADLKKEILDNSRLFHQTLSELANGNLVLLKDLSDYAPLQALLASDHQGLLRQHLEEESYLQNTVLPNFTALNAVAKETGFFTRIQQEKHAQVDRYKRVGRLFGWMSNSRDAWTGTYVKTLQDIQRIPDKQTRDLLLKSFKNIYGATTKAVADTHLQKFQALWNQRIQQEKDKLLGSARKLRNIDEPIYELVQRLATQFTDDLTARSEDNAILRPQLQESMNKIQTAINALEDISFVTTDIGIVDSLKKLPLNLIYGRLKPKMDGLVDLIRNGAFSQFFVNHALLMPLVK